MWRLSPPNDKAKVLIKGPRRGDTKDGPGLQSQHTAGQRGGLFFPLSLLLTSAPAGCGGASNCISQGLNKTWSCLPHSSDPGGRGDDVRLQSRNKKRFIMSARRAEATGRLLQDHLHVATLLEVNRQWWVSHKWCGWPPPHGSERGAPANHQDLGRGLTRSAAPVESQTELKVAALSSRVEISFVLERKNLCPLIQVCRWRLSLANWDLDQMILRLI